MGEKGEVRNMKKTVCIQIEKQEAKVTSLIPLSIKEWIAVKVLAENEILKLSNLSSVEEEVKKHSEETEQRKSDVERIAKLKATPVKFDMKQVKDYVKNVEKLKKKDI